MVGICSSRFVGIIDCIDNREFSVDTGGDDESGRVIENTELGFFGFNGLKRKYGKSFMILKRSEQKRTMQL